MKLKSPIYKWGIELEAGYMVDVENFGMYKNFNFKKFKDVYPDLWKKSLPKLGWVAQDECITARYPAEFVVYPPTDNPKALISDLRKIYQIVSTINNTMGLHIHVSFNSVDTYHWLTSKDYIFRFQDEIVKEFPETSSRLNGGWAGKYPQRVNSDYILFYGTKTHCLSYQYNTIGTLEYRVFPAVEDVSRIQEYMKFVSNSVSSFMSGPTPTQHMFTKDLIVSHLKGAVDASSEIWKGSPLSKELYGDRGE